MHFKFLLLATFCSSTVFAGGCPPWQMCGKRGNLIIPDSSYSAQVADVKASAPTASTASSFELPSSDQSADINTRITNSKKQAHASSNATVRMFENGDHAFRQQYLASTASSFELPSSDQSADINTRITNSKKQACATSNATVRMFENGNHAFRQQYLSMHPKPGFWGYDWGSPEK